MAKRPARATSGRYVSRLTSGTLAVIMAGGRGERLKGLTEHRAKPATPFGGKFRIIDFVLSNCVNSGIRQITVLTQYKAQSLIQHIHRGWGYMRGEFGEFVEVIPAQQKTGTHWYRGTSDAVYQNIDVMHSHRPKHVLVLAGDHIYKMDYGPMIAYHVEKGADITVGVVEVPIVEAKEFGVLTVTEWNRVTRFVEKSPTPDPMPGRTDVALASMGIYVFNPELLEKLLIEDAADEKSKHDFGKDIIPKAIEKLQVFVIEGIQFIALRIEHPEHVAVIVAHRYDDLGTSRMKRRQISQILAHVAYDDRLTGLQGRTAQSLTGWKTWISGRFVAAFGHYHELVLNDLVNANPAIIARGANHLDELLHSLSRASARQGKRPDLLKILARDFLHSRESNLVHNKPSASRISTFCGGVRLLDNDVDNTRIGADGWSVKE